MWVVIRRFVEACFHVFGVVVVSCVGFGRTAGIIIHFNQGLIRLFLFKYELILGVFRLSKRGYGKLFGFCFILLEIYSTKIECTLYFD